MKVVVVGMALKMKVEKGIEYRTCVGARGERFAVLKAANRTALIKWFSNAPLMVGDLILSPTRLSRFSSSIH